MTSQVAQTIYEQMGANSLHGAINLTGSRNVMLGSDNREQGRVEVDGGGYISTDNGLTFSPNVKSRQVKFIVILQPNDTYTVFIWKGYTNSKAIKTGRAGQVINQVDTVYFDQLIDVIDAMYVEFLNEYEDGFLPF